jgi:hypothetical protein
MSVGVLYPFILFGISLLFSAILFSIKSKKQNLNEIRKTIREDAEKAFRSLEQKVVETEEQVSLKQVEAQETCVYVEKKIQELKDDGEELSQLGDALNTYRSMLAQLNIATTQAHEYVVSTNGDATKLQELQHLIDSHEKKTYNILQSFDSGVKEQKFQLETIRTEIESQTNSSVNQIITTRDDSLSQVSNQIGKYQELFDKCDEIQSTHNAILKELIDSQAAYQDKLNAIQKDFENKCDTYLNSTTTKLDEYLSQIQSSANDKLSLVEGSIIKNFEEELNSKKEDTFLRIDEVLQSSIRTISLYDEKLNGSNGNELVRGVNKPSNASLSDDIVKPEIPSTSIHQNFIKEDESLPVNSSIEDLVEEPELPKKEIKPKKKKRRKKKKSNDDIDILAGIDLIDLPDTLSENKDEESIEDVLPFESENSFDQEIPKNIEDINLDSLSSIESFCSTNTTKEDSISDSQLSDTETKEEPVVSVKEPIESVPLEEKKETERNKKDIPLSKEEQKKKLNGTGFGNLLNSYGSNKRVDEVKPDTEPIKSFKPGSIIEKLVEEDKSNDKVPEESVDKLETIESDKDIQKDTVEEDIKVEKDEIIHDNDKKKTSYVPIGEEEEILLD